MASTLQIELPDDQAEASRHRKFPQVEFRDSPLGRQAYVVGASLAVWEVVMVAESYSMDTAQTAMHLHWPVSRVEDVLSYASAYPAEVEIALAQNRSVRREDLIRLLPDARWV